jgi:uncharacterized membrane protein
MKTTVFAIGAALAAALAAGSAAAASMDLSRDMDAMGAKPGWNLKVKQGTKLTLTRPGKSALVATAPGAAISPSGASWAAKSTDGQVLNVTIQNRACALGPSQYPMTAQVKLGAETLSGCADYAR